MCILEWDTCITEATCTVEKSGEHLKNRTKKNELERNRKNLHLWREKSWKLRFLHPVYASCVGRSRCLACLLQSSGSRCVPGLFAYVAGSHNVGKSITLQGIGFWSTSQKFVWCWGHWVKVVLERKSRFYERVYCIAYRWGNSFKSRANLKVWMGNQNFVNGKIVQELGLNLLVESHSDIW